MKKISIIMGVYNCQDTLRESIDSVLRQTRRDWEFIICDDCSSDDTLQIALEYGESDPQRFIILHNNTNLGLNETLNKCLSHATGEYIARQDGDDLSYPDRFEKEAGFLDRHPEYALVSSYMEMFDESGVWGTWKTPERPEKLDMLKNVSCFCHAPCMIRREALVAVGGYSTEKKFLRCEDLNLWYKLYEHGCRGYNLQEPLYQMRDDHNAYKRRTFSNRLNIIRTELDGFRRLHCSLWEYRFFLKKVAKNLILAVMPEALYKRLHTKRLNQ